MRARRGSSRRRRSTRSSAPRANSTRWRSAAAQRVIDEERYVEFGIPPAAVPLIKAGLGREPPSLYGRLISPTTASSRRSCSNTTPTRRRHWWKRPSRSGTGCRTTPAADQFNASTRAGREVEGSGALGADPFRRMSTAGGEDLMTVTYLRDTASRPGFDTAVWRGPGHRLGRRVFVDLEESLIRTLFKLYPWEWIVHERVRPRICPRRAWIEPIVEDAAQQQGLLAHALGDVPGPSQPAAGVSGWAARDAALRAKAAAEPRRRQRHDRGRLGYRGDGGDYGEEGFVWQQMAPLRSATR